MELDLGGEGGQAIFSFIDVFSLNCKQFTAKKYWKFLKFDI